MPPAVLSVPSALKRSLRGRRGMTLLEVLLTLAIFLVGSVGIIGLFVAASVLHKDAVDRRTAAYIAETELAKVQAQPMHEVFAKTVVDVDGDGNPNTPPPPDPAVLAAPSGVPTVAGTAPSSYNPVANFVAPGPLLIESEQAWETSKTAPGVLPPTFTLAGLTNLNHPDHCAVLQPRTWEFVLIDNPLTANATVVNVDTAGSASAPATAGYIVIDKEWIRYSGAAAGSFSIDTTDADGDGVPDARGYGQTAATAHTQGSPVTIAKEYPGYPGFWYTVQYYPVNATGAEAHVIVTVGYGTEKRFRVQEFEGVYTPSQY